MIEAVNSALSNASANRNTVDQQSTVRSTAANPNRVQEAARVPFVSPAISIDKQSNRAIIQIRDSDTGDVIRQFPTEGQLKAYQTAQEFSERQAAQAESELRQANGVATPPAIPQESALAAPVAGGGNPIQSVSTEA